MKPTIAKDKYKNEDFGVILLVKMNIIIPIKGDTKDNTAAKTVGLSFTLGNSFLLNVASFTGFSSTTSP